jgi:hypothetical protein
MADTEEVDSDEEAQFSALDSFDTKIIIRRHFNATFDLIIWLGIYFITPGQTT